MVIQIKYIYQCVVNYFPDSLLNCLVCKMADDENPTYSQTPQISHFQWYNVKQREANYSLYITGTNKWKLLFISEVCVIVLAYFCAIFVNHTVEVRNVTVCTDSQQTGQKGKQGQKPQRTRLRAAWGGKKLLLISALIKEMSCDWGWRSCGALKRTYLALRHNYIFQLLTTRPLLDWLGLKKRAKAVVGANAGQIKS